MVTNIQEGDILFIKKIEQLKRNMLDLLIPAIEAFQIEVEIGKGPSARSIKLELPPFTLMVQPLHRHKLIVN